MRTVGGVEPRLVAASDRRHWQRPVTARAPEDDPAGARTAVGPTARAVAIGGPHDAGTETGTQLVCAVQRC